jgi:hypothetical protein
MAAQMLIHHEPYRMSDVAEICRGGTRGCNLGQSGHEPLRAAHTVGTFLERNYWIDHPLGNSW